MNDTKTKKRGCCGRWIEKCRFCPLFLAILFFLIGFAIISYVDWRWGEKPQPVSYKDTSYRIEGNSVTFINGIAQDPITKTVTRYFGNEALGDLNGDEKTDVAFLVTQQTGGSGTFYYITSALKNDGGYEGTNAVFLGDRIAPQSTQIREGKIIVNYAERKSGQPMTSQPSVGISRTFLIVNGQVVEAK